MIWRVWSGEARIVELECERGRLTKVAILSLCTQYEGDIVMDDCAILLHELRQIAERDSTEDGPMLYSRALDHFVMSVKRFDNVRDCLLHLFSGTAYSYSANLAILESTFLLLELLRKNRDALRLFENPKLITTMLGPHTMSILDQL